MAFFMVFRAQKNLRNCSFPCGYMPGSGLEIMGKHVEITRATAVVAMPFMEYGRGYRRYDPRLSRHLWAYIIVYFYVIL